MLSMLFHWKIETPASLSEKNKHKRGVTRRRLCRNANTDWWNSLTAVDKVNAVLDFVEQLEKSGPVYRGQVAAKLGINPASAQFKKIIDELVTKQYLNYHAKSWFIENSVRKRICYHHIVSTTTLGKNYLNEIRISLDQEQSANPHDDGNMYPNINNANQPLENPDYGDYPDNTLGSVTPSSRNITETQNNGMTAEPGFKDHSLTQMLSSFLAQPPSFSHETLNLNADMLQKRADETKRLLMLFEQEQRNYAQANINVNLAAPAELTGAPHRKMKVGFITDAI